MSRRPDLFLLGAPKCGTTSLYEYLKGHPEIYMSARKEPQYFDFDPARGVHLQYGDDLNPYLSLFAAAGDAKRVGEATTAYLASPVAPERLHDFEPRPFLVVALRDPVQMLHALHGERVAEGVEPLEDFGAALADEAARLAGERGRALAGIVYRPWARFAEQLELWQSVFGRDRLHVIVLDDLIANPAAEFRALLEFLEVDADYQPPAFERHKPSRRARSRRLINLLNARRPRQIVRRVLPMSVRNRTTLPAGRAVRRLNTRRVERTSMDPELAAQLTDEFRPEVERLSAWLGTDLAERWWGARS